MRDITASRSNRRQLSEAADRTRVSIANIGICALNFHDGQPDRCRVYIVGVSRIRNQRRRSACELSTAMPSVAMTVTWLILSGNAGCRKPSRRSEAGEARRTEPSRRVALPTRKFGDESFGVCREAVDLLQFLLDRQRMIVGDPTEQG